ncbi:MAG: ABC transporter permease subunit [Actinobacteria bacterium]|nr:ABC transporter permease subunit [Actinomycetota bacterium]MBO0814120.1 ABC transporter permease subunit [Actinomycetota bacterium]
MVALPVAALTSTAAGGQFFTALTAPQTRAALALTAAEAVATAVIDAVTGVALAWVLVRDEFPGKRLVNALIDLPFALPTIVAGLVLLTLYGPGSPVHLNIAQTRAGILLALLFVTLPFVVRAVQPVLLAADREAEEAAASLGAGPLTTFRRIVLPAILPAMLSGAGLAFARALGEFGSVVLISGNLPFKTMMASVLIAGQVESGDTAGAAAVSVTLLAFALVVIAIVTGAARRLARRHG